MRTAVLFYIVAALFYIPAFNAEGILISPYSCQHLLFISITVTILMDMKWHLVLLLICISLVISDVGCNVYSSPLRVILIWLIVFCTLSCRISFSILDTGRLSDVWFANIFFHSVACLFTVLIMFFDAQKFVIFNVVSFTYFFSFAAYVFGEMLCFTFLKYLLWIFLFFFLWSCKKSNTTEQLNWTGCFFKSFGRGTSKNLSSWNYKSFLLVIIFPEFE